MTTISARTEVTWGPALLTALVLLAAGLLLYRPWEPVPLEMTDFSELLPLFQGGDWFGARLADTVGYYRGHGRLNVVTSAYVVANWELWGSWAPGWRLVRALLMGVVILLTLRLLVRLRVPLSAAAVGASLLVVSQAAAANWLRVTGEPLATLALAGALSVATGYQAAMRWRPRVALLTVLLIVMVLAKEIMIVAVPLVLVLGLCWCDRNRLAWPENSARNRMLVAWAACSSVLVGVAILVVAGTAGPGAYARVYGEGALTPARLARTVGNMLLPSPGFPGSLGTYGFALVVASGWLVKLHRAGPDRWQSAARLGLLLALPVLGGLVYLPWKRFELFYALPFFLGAVFLLSTATAALEGLARGRRWLVWSLVLLLVLLPTGVVADHMGRYVASLRHVNWRLADAVARHSDAERIVVAVRGLPDQVWQGRGPTLERFAEVVHDVDLPSAEDATCRDVAGSLSRPGGEGLVVSYWHECGRIPGATESFQVPYKFTRLIPFRVVRDTIGADLLVR